MKSIHTLVATALTALIVSGCGLENGQEIETDPLAVMVETFGSIAPDETFSATNASAAAFKPQSDAVRTVLLALETVAQPLKESQSRFGELVRNGSRANGSLQIELSTLGLSLTGARDDTARTISWSYVKGGKTYFTGTTPFFGTRGDLTFASDIAGDRPTTLRWEYGEQAGARTRTVRIEKMGFGNVTLMHSFANGTREVETSFSGWTSSTGNITAKWNARGGSLTEGLRKTCWTRNTSGSYASVCADTKP